MTYKKQKAKSKIAKSKKQNPKSKIPHNHLNLPATQFLKKIILVITLSKIHNFSMKK